MKPLYVAFDEQCGLCMRFARLVARLDTDHKVIAESAQNPRHEKLRAAPDRLTALVAWDEENARYLAGFAAVAEIVGRLPGGVLSQPFMRLLSKFGWGDRLYARIAARRKCATR